MQHIKNKDYWYNQENIDYYYNKSSKLIDKIVFSKIDTVNGVVAEKLAIKKTIYEFFDFSFEDNTHILDSIYNLENPMYKYYARSDDNNPHLVCTKDVNKMTDTVLNYPLVNINNDTTTIAKEEGWILLDCWFRGCTSCFKSFEKINKEKVEDNGKIQGIKIMCINPYAADVSRLKQDAVKHNCEDYFYGAKMLDKYLKMNPMPQFYLISPDKKIVYSHTGDLKEQDYQTILKIKKEYSR